MSPIKDQGICGSCWSFGTTGTIEGAYYLKVVSNCLSICGFTHMGHKKYKYSILLVCRYIVLLIVGFPSLVIVQLPSTVSTAQDDGDDE